MHDGLAHVNKELHVCSVHVCAARHVLPVLPAVLQFDQRRVSADELETYLLTKEQEAKESEARALAQADAGAPD